MVKENDSQQFMNKFILLDFFLVKPVKNSKRELPPKHNIVLFM